MSSITDPCRRDYFPAYHDSGPRQVSDIKLIVLHSTEGGTAESVAHYFKGPGAGGSAHLVVDDHGCQRCLPDDRIPWGAPGANSQGFHIEQCAYAAWTREQWEKHLPMLHRVAYKIAQASHRFNIPVTFLSAAALEAGHQHGVTTHRAITKWQNSIGQPGDHIDPGTGWPEELVLTLAQHYRKTL